MGKIAKGVQSSTEQFAKDVHATKAAKTVANVSETAQDVLALAGNAVILSMSKAWIGIGLRRPATTEVNPLNSRGGSVFTRASYGRESDEVVTPNVADSRYDTANMWSMRFGDYYMPLSQTYNASARKRMNVSSLVDGIDIVQQTRKEAKTVDCTLKISVNENQRNLQLVGDDETGYEVKQLAGFLTDLYESDALFQVDNDTLNTTFGIDYAIMTKYKFTPRPGHKTFLFEFSLMEIKYGDNVLTFDENQLQANEVTDDTETTT